MNKIKKKELVKKYKNLLCKYKSIIMLRNINLESNRIVEIKKKLKKNFCVLKIIKNNILKISLEDMEKNSKHNIKGATAIVWTNKPVESIKTLIDEKKKYKDFKIIWGKIFNKQYEEKEILELSRIPEENEVKRKILLLLITNIKKVINMINISTTKILSLIKLKKQK